MAKVHASPVKVELLTCYARGLLARLQNYSAISKHKVCRAATAGGDLAAPLLHTASHCYVHGEHQAELSCHYFLFASGLFKDRTAPAMLHGSKRCGRNTNISRVAVLGDFSVVVGSDMSY
jgi:hypothetical protein